MATAWMTYAWDDNKNQDVDFVAQELERSGLHVKLDRWNIRAGKRLWEQIAHFIESPSESDAWLLFATTNSLASEGCKEELAYALDRALDARGKDFPVIALFPSPVDRALIPPAVRIRLYISLTDPDWKERIKAAAEGRAHQPTRTTIDPFVLRVHARQPGRWPIAIEVRPRAGTWAPFVAGIPIEEKDAVAPSIMIGPADVPTRTGMLNNFFEKDGGDGLWIMSAQNQSSPIQSYYIWCKRLPTRLFFGVNAPAPAPQFEIPFPP